MSIITIPTFDFRWVLPLKELYGRFPEFLDVMAVIRNIYGDDFIEIFERSFENFKESLEEYLNRLLLHNV